MVQDTATLDDLLDGIRAAADPSRLRLLAICSQGEWTVSELVQILGQSQPRISRHLKILAEAGLLDRFREGSWVFYRRAQSGDGARLARSLCRLLPGGDAAMRQDQRRLEAVREGRRRQAERFFDARADAWDQERALAIDPVMVESALRELFARERPANLLDIGTGTGRILQVLAGQVGFGLGIDLSHDMLAVARANLDQREARNCQVRHGDMYQLPLPDASFAAATLHQVLHYADDPFAALTEAVRVLAPGGWLVVADLANHEVERLREQSGHRRLGFSDEEIARWFKALGLIPDEQRRLVGPDLTVVIWTARRPPAEADLHDPHAPQERCMNLALADRPEARPHAWMDEALPPVELSIEVFPPKGPDAAARLWSNVEQFVAMRPRFISVTCGAGGSGVDGTLPLVCGIQETFGVPVAAHMTCAWSSRAEIDELARDYWRRGVRRIVALRGDPPKGAQHYTPRPDGYAYATDLIAGLKAVADFEITAGCYPEIHPEAQSAEADLENLRRKVEAGATRLVTQYCFDTDQILRFRDRLDAAGIAAEYVPGIMPIHNFAQIKRFSQGCGAGIPPWLERLFDGVEETSPMHGMIAASIASEQCRRLAAEGLTRMHVYALNRAELPLAIRHLLAAHEVPVAA